MKSRILRLLNKYKSIPISAKAALWFVICSVLQKGMAFITVPIFTRLMPTEQYGLYSTYLSCLSVVTVFCTLNMHNCIYINNVTKADSEKEKDQAAIPLLTLSEAITIVIFFIYFLIRSKINQLIGLPTTLVVLMFAQIFFEPPINFWSIKQRYEYKYVQLVIRTLMMTVANAILGIIFVLLVDNNHAIARAYSVVIVYAVFGGIFYLYFFKRAKKIFSTRDWRHSLSVQLPLLPHGLSLTILSSSDRIMITSLVGATATAIYSVAYSAGYVVNVLKNSITDALRPWIYNKIKNEEYDEIKVTTRIVMIIVTVITFAFVAFAPEIIMIMAPAKYGEAIYVIPPVAASSFFTFLYNMFSSVSFYYEKTKKIMIASMTGAGLNIILNAICIPRFGYVAAGYTTMICYMFFSFAHFILMQSVCKENGIKAEIFDLRFILTMAAIVILMTIVFTYIYQNMIARYIIIIGLGVLIFINREKYIATIKNVKKGKR